MLATTDDDHSDGGLFIEQRSARVKRRRPQLAQQRQQKPTDQGTLQQNQTQRRRAPTMIGKSTTSSASVAADKQIRKKAVFCVDNVDTSYTADDTSSFVSSMSISVISCFEVKPRRRRNDEGKLLIGRLFVYAFGLRIKITCWIRANGRARS